MLDGLSLLGSSILLLTVAGGLMGFALAAVARRRRDVAISGAYARLATASGAWCLADALLLVSPSFEAARLIHDVGIVASFASAFLWFQFAVEYAGHGEKLTRRVRGLVWLELLAYAVVLFTNRFHGLAHTDVEMVSFGALTLIGGTLTALTWFQVGLVYVEVLGGLGVLLAFYPRTRNVLRKQTGAMVAGGLFVIVGNLSFLLGLTPDPRLDLTPVFFVGNGVVIWWALFRYDFLGLSPMALDTLVDHMADAVLVVDDDDRVVDQNPSAESLFGERVGDSLETVAPGLVDAIEAETAFVADDSVARAEAGRVYEPRRTAFSDARGVRRGSFVVLRDVTVREHREMTLTALQRATSRFNRGSDAETIAEIAVETADEVLDYPFAGVLLHDSEANVLRSAALTDALATYAEEPFVVTPDGLVWDAFETGERREYDADNGLDAMQYSATPVERMLVLPLGDHGVFGVGTGRRERRFTDDDVRFATLLATATETALDRVRREEQLRESRATAEERKRQIEFFNGILRHDILNGLMVVRGNAELLAESATPEQEPCVERIREWSADMTTLTERTRSAVDAVTTDDGEALEPIDLSSVVDRKAAKIRDTYATTTLAVDVAPDLTVRGDALIDEVVENVLLNAIEHNDTDAPSLTVTGSRDGDRVSLRVADDGPGITDECKESVFDRDVTTTDGDGFGFGLYFVRMMMRRYGGRVWFEDNVPRGAVAILDFAEADSERTTHETEILQ